MSPMESKIDAQAPSAASETQNGPGHTAPARQIHPV